MKNEITNRNILLLSFSLISFLIIFTIVFSYYNRKNLEHNLVNVSKILNEQIIESDTEEDIQNTVNLFTRNHNWLRISIFNSHGNIVIDSVSDNRNIALDDAQKKVIDMAEPKPYIGHSDFDGEKILYYGVRVNEDIIVRTAVPLTDYSGVLLSGMFFMGILIVFSILLSVFFTNKTATNIMGAFALTIDNLKNINEGKYVPISLEHKYFEVKEVLTEINDINEKISTSLVEIKSERDKMNFVLDNINQGILLVDQAGAIIIINKKVKDVFELQEDPTDKNYESALKLPKLNSIIKKTFKTETPTSVDYYNANDDKVYSFNANLLSRDWIFGAANFNGVVVIISDVTEERKNSQIKDEFIANASHELKTPITSISGFWELINSGMVKDDATKNDYVNRMVSETVKLKKIIDNLLSLSTLDSIKTQSDDIEVNFKDIALEVKNSYSYIAGKADINILLDCDDAFYMANPQLIYHVISNLVDNAIKYNRPGGYVKVIIKTQGNNIHLTIEDNGIGIEKKNLDRIFARFYRTDDSRSRLTGGSGLGLSIVKKVCTLYDAHISVESEINIGTKVSIIFR